MTVSAILIVEAESVMGRELEDRVQKLGYQVVAVVDSGEKTIDIIATKKPDLVLMDYKLNSKLDGIEVAAWIRSQLSIPVVFLTTDADEAKIKQAKLVQPCCYLSKPVQDRELRVTLEMVLHMTQLAAERQKIEKQLNQRIKELECFYGISKLVNIQGLSLNEMLAGIINLIAQAWQYTEVAHSRILFVDGGEILCPHGKLPIKEEWSMSVAIKHEGEKIGVLTVFYTEARPAADEGVFLKQERLLLDALGERVGKIIARYRMQQALQASEKRYQTILETAPIGIQFSDLNGVITYSNQAHQKIHGSTRDQIVSRQVWSFNATEEQRKEEQKQYDQFLKSSSENVSFVYSDITADGNAIDVVINRCKLFNENNQLDAVCTFITDITEAREAEVQIKAALKEKEVLLQEIHHRVKNNLAVVASLLDLQHNKTNDEKLKRILRDSRNRLYTMSLVHEFLYRSENLSEIDIKKYLTNLVHMIRQSFGTGVEIELQLTEHTINLEKATTIGLVVNELITNTFKYAFPNTNRGKLIIGYTSNTANVITLTVTDDGIGLPESFEWQETDSLGLNLVKTLVEDQLDGTVSLTRGKGTQFTITFPETGLEK